MNTNLKKGWGGGDFASLELNNNFITVLLFTTLACQSLKDCVGSTQISLSSLLFKEHLFCAHLVQMCAGYQTTQVKQCLPHVSLPSILQPFTQMYTNKI